MVDVLCPRVLISRFDQCQAFSLKIFNDDMKYFIDTMKILVRVPIVAKNFLGLESAVHVNAANSEALSITCALRTGLMDTKQQFLHFGETGYLKTGVHDCTWDAFQKLTFTNSHRVDLGTQLMSFLSWPIRLGTFRWVYIGGGFVSRRPFPRDIDLILETQFRFGPEAFGAIEPFFAWGLDKILEVYSVHLHFRMEGAPSTHVDYCSFFQYRRSREVRCFNATKRGIVRLALRPEHLVTAYSSRHGGVPIDAQGKSGTPSEAPDFAPA
jgi:hypothetical protein